ncbi:hypothetical protein VOLCADRAFT_116092 [Volvox carteri f. nagariensis]|uniref:Small ribosomal subunit protein mS29 n=1 Tax=Volvox carteri f. nagariensis TaxID=3068 RepID=D8TKK3_VOLCA|nr:uncharacterized protein VOLCADRAFT_116092 [Volvox carteri f. nagariensis]EFJ52077.1 hypothetical protein VOLCADRAFT_116092 [Volvox carteri f. nagariensis]|eukprot:XP_002946851.1 hypothetical protein VOLCADRAFT_116092 [Volvox carteri f. nagariensis]
MSLIGRLATKQSAWLNGLIARSAWASFATAAIDESASHQPSTSGQAKRIRSKELSAASVGAYYSLDPAVLPEAGQVYAGAFYAPREPGHERHGGCKALQQEVSLTGTHSIMYRPVMHNLFNALGAHDRHHQRLLLSGPAGSGKSIALVGLVEWARSSNRWDTLTSAQQLLKGLMDAHGPKLKQMPVLSLLEEQQPQQQQHQRQPAAGAAASDGALSAEAEAAAALRESFRGRTLYDLATGALRGDDNAQLAADTVLELVRQLMAASSVVRDGKPQSPVLFALDDYNCLYGGTDYGWYSPREDPRRARRRPIHSDDLVLASGLRLMDTPQLGTATVVAATTTSLSLPAPPAPPALRMPHTELRVPGFSEAEVRNALAHYHATGYASCLATSRQARQLHALTQGNARELRMNTSTLGLKLS